MKTLFRTACLLLVCFTSALAKDQEETIFLFQNRKVNVVVPKGLGFSSDKDERGVMTVQVADPKGTVHLHLTFLPDGENQFGSPRGRKEFLHDTFKGDVSSSVEKAMQFEELEPKSGAGTYYVVTDASLVGKTKLPAGEFLHCTTGVKTWPGVVVIFKLFSNDLRSKEYQAAMTMLRESVQEKPAVGP